MKPEIIEVAARHCIGIRHRMSLVNNLTAQLWGRFLSQRNQMQGVLSQERISLQVYAPDYFQAFDPAKEFEKWALVPVEPGAIPPEGMEHFLIPGGTYAVFHYKGSSLDSSVFQYIYGTWLPGSAYELDQRPHFEILGEKYKNADPESEEEIWIPVRQRQ